MFYNLKRIDQIGKLFNILENCQGVNQAEKYHPEGDVFIHSIQVLKWAMRESTDIDLIFAAMLHDVGKQIDKKGHEDYSIKMLNGLISNKTAWLIKNHMRFWYFIRGDMRKLSSVKDLHQNKWIPDLCMLARWDKLGRNPHLKIEYNRIEIIEKLQKIQTESDCEAIESNQYIVSTDQNSNFVLSHKDNPDKKVVLATVSEKEKNK